MPHLSRPLCPTPPAHHRASGGPLLCQWPWLTLQHTHQSGRAWGFRVPVCPQPKFTRSAKATEPWQGPEPRPEAAVAGVGPSQLAFLSFPRGHGWLGATSGSQDIQGQNEPAHQTPGAGAEKSIQGGTLKGQCSQATHPHCPQAGPAPTVPQTHFPHTPCSSLVLPLVKDLSDQSGIPRDARATIPHWGSSPALAPNPEGC